MLVGMRTILAERTPETVVVAVVTVDRTMKLVVVVLAVTLVLVVVAEIDAKPVETMVPAVAVAVVPAVVLMAVPILVALAAAELEY